MITLEAYTATLVALAENLPRQKAMSELGLSLACATTADLIFQTIGEEHLAYAVAQRLKDPQPDERLALHVQLWRYLYPLVDGIPREGLGLIPDLRDRMRSPNVFHGVVHHRPEARDCRQLLPPSRPLVSEGPEERKARLGRLRAMTLGGDQ